MVKIFKDLGRFTVYVLAIGVEKSGLEEESIVYIGV
jgi:hypothetical protein